MQQRLKRNHLLHNLLTEYNQSLLLGTPFYMDDRDLISLAEFLEESQQFEKALEVVEYAIKIHPFRAEFLYFKARYHLYMEECALSLETIESALLINPNDPEAKLLQAQAYSMLEDYDIALVLIEQYHEQCSYNCLTEYFSVKTYILECAGLYEEMFECITKWLEQFPTDEEALEKMWMAMEINKYYHKAIKIHQDIIEFYPYTSLAWYNLGHAYSSLGEYDKAIDALEYSFIIDPYFLPGYKDCAELCIQTMNYHKALDIYLEAEAIYDKDCDLIHCIGETYVHLNNYKKGKLYLYKASKIDPFCDESLYYLGLCYLGEKKYKKAVEYFHNAIKIEDRREEYYSALAKAYDSLEEYIHADYYYRKAAVAGPENSIYWYQHATFLMKLGNYDEALEVLDEAESHAVGADLLYCRGALLMQKREEEKGIELLREALEEDPKSNHLLDELYPAWKDDERIMNLIKYFEF